MRVMILVFTILAFPFFAFADNEKCTDAIKKYNAADLISVSFPNESRLLYLEFVRETNGLSCHDLERLREAAILAINVLEDIGGSQTRPVLSDLFSGSESNVFTGDASLDTLLIEQIRADRIQSLEDDVKIIERLNELETRIDALRSNTQ